MCPGNLVLPRESQKAKAFVVNVRRSLEKPEGGGEGGMNKPKKKRGKGNDVGLTWRCRRFDRQNFGGSTNRKPSVGHWKNSR